MKLIFNQKSTADGFQINESKGKEFCISFAPYTRELVPANGPFPN
jgi:hypothetical protein